MYIIIPKKQYAHLGAPISVILKTSKEIPNTDHSVTQIHLLCEVDNMTTDSEDVEFYVDDYQPHKHIYPGIKRPFEFLLKNILAIKK